MSGKNEPATEDLLATTPPATNANGKKRWFGRGIYGSKDVPIRALDTCIVLMIVAAIVLTVFNANLGGFTITFNTAMRDVTVAAQKVKHGEQIAQPETPLRPGYTLVGWAPAEDSTTPWEFSTPVQGDMTLYALWQPAQMLVKLDLAGGQLNGSSTAPDLTVTYGEPYGNLPTPEKAGAHFAGWVYSGNTITAQTTVQATGEHQLTAVWQ
ncbi:MAG: InlB B-repeat-containing protein [Gemmiger sp.]|nr:InlB B-repeat-containing protein [Gemmiger sp.]